MGKIELLEAIKQIAEVKQNIVEGVDFKNNLYSSDLGGIE